MLAKEKLDMNADEMRAIQAPLKERYRADPKAALITLRASGSLDSAAIACKVETGRAIAAAGPASRDRRERGGALLRRHAARGAGRLRRRDAEGGRDVARRRRCARAR